MTLRVVVMVLRPACWFLDLSFIPVTSLWLIVHVYISSANDLNSAQRDRANKAHGIITDV